MFMFHRAAPLYFVCLVLLIATSIPYPVNGQGGLRTLNAPINAVELSGIEPLPTGVLPQVSFGIFPFNPPPHTNVPTPQWIGNLPASASPFDSASNLLACGYPAGSLPPQGTLTYPDGHSGPIAATNYEAIDPSAVCWKFDLNMAYGMQLGQYTLTVNHPAGQLTHTWLIDYGKSSRMIQFVLNNQTLDLLMGFVPNATVQLDFYTVKGLHIPNIPTISDYYVASRTFQADSNGAFALKISVSRSAPFTRNMIVYKVNLMVDAPTPTSIPTSTPMPIPVSGTGACPGFTIPSRVKIGGQARVTPGDPNLILSDPLQLTEGATNLGEIPPGGVMTILDGPACDVDILFWKVKYNGVIGWTGEGQANAYWIELVQ